MGGVADGKFAAPVEALADNLLPVGPLPYRPSLHIPIRPDILTRPNACNRDDEIKKNVCFI